MTILKASVRQLGMIKAKVPWTQFGKGHTQGPLCQVWTLHRCFLPSLATFGQAVSEEIFLHKSKIGFVLLSCLS
jgi:hypothetical protein